MSVLKKMKFQMQICIISPVFSPRISSPNSSFTLVLCCLTDFLIVFRFALMRLYARKCSIENGEWRDRAICEVCVGLYYFFTLKSRESMQVLEDAFLRSTQNFQSSSEIAQKKCRIDHEIYWSMIFFSILLPLLRIPMQQWTCLFLALEPGQLPIGPISNKTIHRMRYFIFQVFEREGVHKSLL